MYEEYTVTTWISSIPTPSASSTQLLAELKALEGDRIDVTLRDGSRLEDCQLVSTGRLWNKSIWVLQEDVDLFIRIGDIALVRAASSRSEAWP
jgi:hypothetical protein